MDLLYSSRWFASAAGRDSVQQTEPHAPGDLRKTVPLDSYASTIPSDAGGRNSWVAALGKANAKPDTIPNTRNRRALRTFFRRPLFSYSYELLFPPARRTLGGQTLCFDNHPHCPGVWEANSRIASVFLCALCVSVANPFFSYYCELFVVAKKVICLGIKNFRTLLQKHPGWGVSIHDKLVSRSRSPWSSQPRDVSVRRFSPSHEQARRSSSGTTTYTRQPYASLCAARRSTCRASPSVAHVLSLSSPLRVLPLREAYVSKSLCRERAVGARAAAQKGTTKP